MASPWVWVGAVVVVAVLAVAVVWVPGGGAVLFPLDDAYITLTNARTLLGVADGSFAADPLVGATSALHLALLALAGLVVPLEPANLMLNGLAAAAYAVGLVRLLGLLGLGPGATTALAAVGLGAGHVPFQLFNGLETGIAMAAVVWCMVLLHQGSRRALPLLCGVLPFIRPELAALTVGVMLHRAVLLRRDPGAVARDLGWMIAGAAPLALGLWAGGAGLLPNTSGAKAAFFAEGGTALRDKARVAAVVLWESGLLAVLLGIACLGRWRGAWALWVFAAAFLAVMTLSFPGGLAHNLHRYLAPLVPIGVAGLAVLLAGGGRARWLLVPLAALAVQGAVNPVRAVVEGQAFAREMVTTAAWMNAGLPPGAVVLIHDAGHVAWATEFPLVDIVGLKTPSSVPIHERWTQPSGGRDRARAVHEIALAGGVSHAVILDAPFWGETAAALRAHGWRLDPLRVPQGEGYVVYALTPPGG